MDAWYNFISLYSLAYSIIIIDGHKMCFDSTLAITEVEHCQFRVTKSIPRQSSEK